MSQFQNLKYSQSEDSKTSSSFSAELTFGLLRKSESFHSLFGYDLRQAFFVIENESDALAIKQSLHRAFYEGSYYFNDRFSLAGQVGYNLSSGNISLTGPDFGVSAYMRLGYRRNFIIGLHHKRSQLKDNRNQEFENSISSVSLGYGF